MSSQCGIKQNGGGTQFSETGELVTAEKRSPSQIPSMVKNKQKVGAVLFLKDAGLGNHNRLAQSMHPGHK